MLILWQALAVFGEERVEVEHERVHASTLAACRGELEGRGEVELLRGYVAQIEILSRASAGTTQG